MIRFWPFFFLLFSAVITGCSKKTDAPSPTPAAVVNLPKSRFVGPESYEVVENASEAPEVKLGERLEVRGELDSGDDVEHTRRIIIVRIMSGERILREAVAESSFNDDGSIDYKSTLEGVSERGKHKLVALQGGSEVSRLDVRFE